MIESNWGKKLIRRKSNSVNLILQFENDDDHVCVYDLKIENSEIN